MREVSAYGLAPLVLAASLACRGTPADPVQELRAELEAAAEARDAERFGRHLSEDLQGTGGLTRAGALATLRRYFAAYESVDLEVYGLEIDRAGSAATIRCVVEFAGRARSIGALGGLLPPEAVYRFELGVADEAGVWRVRRATWQRVAPGPGAGG